MRLFAPRLAYDLGGEKCISVGYDQAQVYPGCFLWSGNDEYEIPDPSYFYNTKGREFNDVIHVKIVDSDGNSTLPVLYVGEKQIRDNYLSSTIGTWVWAPDGRQFHYGNTLWINRGNLSASLNFGFSGVGLTQTTITISEFILDMSERKYYSTLSSYKYTPLRIQIRWQGYKFRADDGTECSGHRVYETLVLNSALPIPSDYIQAFEAITNGWVMVGPKYSAHDNTRATADMYLHVAKDLMEWIWRWDRQNNHRYLVGRALPALSWVSDYEEIDLSQFLKFHESERVIYGLEPATFGRGMDTYWFNIGIQNAYLDAIKSVPRLNENSISNIIEIASFIKSLVIDHRIDIPKSLSSVWLSYRYQYTTTKLDAEEAIQFVHRYMDLGTLDKWITCFGTHTLEYQDTIVTFRCGLKIRPKEVSKLADIWRSLYTYGLTPSFYAVWDMIPYSFIIDWFLPIGKLADVLDAERMYSDTYYEIEDVIFSLSYDMADEIGNSIHAYTRFLSGSPVTLNGFYFFEEDPVSAKVIGYRALDTLSLILG